MLPPICRFNFYNLYIINFTSRFFLRNYLMFLSILNPFKNKKYTLKSKPRLNNIIARFWTAIYNIHFYNGRCIDYATYNVQSKLEGRLDRSVGSRGSTFLFESVQESIKPSSQLRFINASQQIR